MSLLLRCFDKDPVADEAWLVEACPPQAAWPGVFKIAVVSLRIEAAACSVADPRAC